MPLDWPTFLFFVAIPGVVACLGALVGWRLEQRSNVTSLAAKTLWPKLAATVVVLGWWTGVTASVFAADKPMLWSDEAWPRMIWPMLVASLMAAPLWPSKLLDEIEPWAGYACIAVLAASLVMPEGEAWADTIPTNRIWIPALAIASTINALSLFRMSQRGAQRWLPWVLIAGLGCSAIVGAASYSALFEACLGAIVSTLVIAVFATSGALALSSAILFPCLLLASCMIASGRFYSYDDVSPLAYTTALFAPTLIATADWWFRKRSLVVRVSVSAIAAILLIGLTGFWFLVG